MANHKESAKRKFRSQFSLGTSESKADERYLLIIRDILNDFKHDCAPCDTEE